MEDKLIKDIKESIISSEQMSIFEPDIESDRLEKACANYLKHKGYTIVCPKIFSVNIKNADGLIEYFYMLLNSSRPEGYMTSFNHNQDRAIAKRFIEDRMNLTGASREYALNECGAIIKTLFEHLEEFNFKYQIGFYIFGNDNLKWVTNKALQILNNGVEEAEEKRAEVLREEMLAAQDTSDLGFDDLDDLLAKMEEENNGKKD